MLVAANRSNAAARLDDLRVREESTLPPEIYCRVCCADRLDGRMAARIAVGCQHVGIVLSRYNSSDNPHPSRAGDVGDDMMKLQVHLHQGLLHVLDVSSCVFHEPLPLAQIRTQAGGIRAEAPA